MKLDDIKIGGKSTGLCQQKGVNCTITPDSGTSMLTMPKKHFKKFKESHGGFDCTKEDFNEIPEISYVIGGVEYALPAHHWMNRTIDPKNKKGGRCETSVSDLDVGFDGLEDMFILGDQFMQYYYTIHDHENDQVGFAPAIHQMDEALMIYNSEDLLEEV